MHDRPSTARALAAVLALVLAVVAGVVAGPPAGAGTEHRRGPDPTLASISAPTGPFATASVSVPSSVPGFGGGVVHYPTDTSQGRFGGVALAPGFLGSSSNYAWAGPRLASQGFVVLLMNTNSRTDLPPSRGDQLLAALDWLVTSSPTAVRSRLDSTRLAVAGHSMGGGGALEASLDRPSLQASIPLQPWHTPASFAGVTVPTMIIGAEADTTAPVASHAEPFYESLTGASDRAYLEVNGAEHRLGTSNDTTQARFVISWLKRFVDDDTRYEQFLCPPPSPSSLIEEYRHSCPGPA